MNGSRKNFIITGISSGLGKAIGLELLCKGHHVWGIARRRLNEWDNDGTFRNSTNFSYSTCDLTVVANVEEVLNDIKKADFTPDIVILNAGIMGNDFEEGFSETAFKRTYNVNLFGAISLITAFLPLFLESNAGTFVAISSLSSYRALNVKQIAYGGSKAALNMTFECFRVQMPPSSKVRFITINPGGMVKDNINTGLLKITYSKAAMRIIRHIMNDNCPCVLDFPLLNSLICKAFKYLPDSIVSKVIRYYSEN